ncbi:hypothetical protein XELAEV_18019603mg [Xenopus laevis]|uniref:Uncharacterized protein n=1 Tax=Xenopus laevis TaxID=8355 RepID=A0A974DFG2_XENLA|nr:hypothetical protein XELAEV_18019603mg [Xenopus laevis]
MATYLSYDITARRKHSKASVREIKYNWTRQSTKYNVAPSFITVWSRMGTIIVDCRKSHADNCWRKKYMGDWRYRLEDTNTMMRTFSQIIIM